MVEVRAWAPLQANADDTVAATMSATAPIAAQIRMIMGASD
jgi:hypothetical protein